MATIQRSDSQKPARRRAPEGAPMAAPPSSATPERSDVSNEARYVMIQEAAYLRAERRGFEPGFELDDWIAAEQEVDALLRAPPGDTETQ